MNAQKAAQLTLEKVDSKKYWVCRDADGRGVGHAMWMLEGIILGYIEHDKAQRWLGYAQGILVCHSEVTLVDVKFANQLSAGTK